MPPLPTAPGATVPPHGSPSVQNPADLLLPNLSSPSQTLPQFLLFSCLFMFLWLASTNFREYPASWFYLFVALLATGSEAWLFLCGENAVSESIWVFVFVTCLMTAVCLVDVFVYMPLDVVRGWQAGKRGVPAYVKQVGVILGRDDHRGPSGDRDCVDFRSENYKQ